jgi:hypothetical protein
MSDRPTAVNGKRNQAWGTTSSCPECGECLCFGCHPHGPCCDEEERPGAAVQVSPSADAPAFDGWTFVSPPGLRVAGLSLRSR